MIIKKYKYFLFQGNFFCVLLKSVGKVCCNTRTMCTKIKSFYISRAVSFQILNAKGQLILRTNSKLLIWTKKLLKCFFISTLTSKSGQINKIWDEYMINSTFVQWYRTLFPYKPAPVSKFFRHTLMNPKFRPF